MAEIAANLHGVSLRERVGAILTRPDRDDETRVHDAIEEVAGEVDEVTRRLAVIDPEWELLTRRELKGHAPQRAA